MRRTARTVLLLVLSAQLAWGATPPCTRDEVYQPATNTCARVDCQPEYEGARDYWNPPTRVCVSSCPSGGFDALTKVCIASSPAPPPMPSPTASPSSPPAQSPSPPAPSPSPSPSSPISNPLSPPAPAPAPSPSPPAPSPSPSPSPPISDPLSPPASALPPLPVADNTSGPTTAIDCGAHGRIAADGTTCDCDAGWEPVPDALTGSKACDSPVFEQPPLSRASSSSSSSNSNGRTSSTGGAPSAAGLTGRAQMILFVVGAVGFIGLVGGTVLVVRRRRRLRAKRGTDDGALGARAGCADSPRTAASGATHNGGRFDPRGYRPGFDSLDASLGRALSPAQEAATATALSETPGSSLFGETTSSQFFLEASPSGQAATSSSTDGPAALATATQLECIEMQLAQSASLNAMASTSSSTDGPAALATATQLECIEFEMQLAQSASLDAMASGADGHPTLEHRAKRTERLPAFCDLDALCKAELGAASYGAQALAKQP